MSREQIEEMANDLAQHCPDLVANCCGASSCVSCLTRFLYEAGYRKIIFCKGCVYCEYCYPAKAVGRVAEEGWYCNLLKNYVDPDDFCSLAKMKGGERYERDFV